MVVVIADSYVYTVSLALGWGGGIEMSFVAINGMPARTSTSIFSNTSPSKKNERESIEKHTFVLSTTVNG